MKRVIKIFAVCIFGFCLADNLFCQSGTPFTREERASWDENAFMNFRFFISDDVKLYETVRGKRDMNFWNSRIRSTTYENTIQLERTTTGRVLNLESQKIEVYFERRGIPIINRRKPSMTFLEAPDGYYYLDAVYDDWEYLEESGKKTTNYGAGIEYDGKWYFVSTSGKPYLLFEEDKKVKRSDRTIRGVR